MNRSKKVLNRKFLTWLIFYVSFSSSLFKIINFVYFTPGGYDKGFDLFLPQNLIALLFVLMGTPVVLWHSVNVIINLIRRKKND